MDVLVEALMAEERVVSASRIDTNMGGSFPPMQETEMLCEGNRCL